MKIDAIKLNTNYYTPNKDSKAVSSKGEYPGNETTTLPAPSQDVTQFTNKLAPTTASDGLAHNKAFGQIFQAVRRFFQTPTEPAPWTYTDLGIMYKY